MKKSQKFLVPLIITIISMLLFIGSIVGDLVSNEIEDEVKIVFGSNYRLILILLFSALTIISGVFTWLQWPYPSDDEDSKSLDLLKSITVDELREGLGKGGTINWIDRNTTHISQLRFNGRVVITGKMKLGKTREALELIQKAINNELIASHRIYKPNALFLSVTQEISTSQLNIELEHPMLLIIDDLPYHYSGNKLKILEELLNKLKVCKDLFIIATARTDQISEEHKTWLDSQNFRIAEVPELDETQTGLFIDRASRIFNLQIEKSARSVFIGKRDGTPELILIGMRNLNNRGIRQVTEKIAQGVADESIAEAWLETRRYIEKQNPCAKYIFSALTIFYSARLRPNTYLVLHYASKLWKEDKTGKRNWRRVTGLRQALKYLEQFEITNRNETIYHADFIAENDMDPDYAQNLIGAFLLKHRSIFRNNLLRRFYWQSKAQAQELFDLGVEKQLRNSSYLEAEQYYKDAIKFFPHADIYNNLGVVLRKLKRYIEAEKAIRNAIKKKPNSSGIYSNLGSLLSSQNRYIDAEEALKEAIKKDPYFAPAYHNLGMVFEYTERLTEAAIAYRIAIKIDPYIVEAHSRIGNILLKSGHLNEGIDRLLTGMWNDPTGQGREFLLPFITPHIVKDGEEGTNSISDNAFLNFHVEIADNDEDE